MPAQVALDPEQEAPVSKHEFFLYAERTPCVSTGGSCDHIGGPCPVPTQKATVSIQDAPVPLADP